MNRRNAKRSSSRFGMVPHNVFAHEAVTTLHHAQFRALVLLIMQFNGNNNGALGLTASQAANNGISSDKTLYIALRELEARGLIEQTYHASRVPPRPTMYALSWIAVHDTEYSQKRRMPTHAYREWKAPAKRRRRRKPKLRAVP